MSIGNIIDLAKDKGISFLLNEPLSKHTTFKIGGNAQVILSPKKESEIVEIIKQCKATKTDYFILGKGSNIVASDWGYQGVIIKTDGLNNLEILEDNKLRASAGLTLCKVATFAYHNSFTGLEFAHGIPGTLGGAVYMNAGAYGGEMKKIVLSTRFIDENGDIKEITGEEHQFSYRKSVFSIRNVCILDTILQLEIGEKQAIKNEMDRLSALRKEKQPLNFPSAGSVFKRPQGFYAGELIEKSGLKGFKVGGAFVSEKHCGFIVSDGNATCEDVFHLVEIIKDKVYNEFGVMLECEIMKLQ